jgi:hypothetical protein
MVVHPAPGSTNGTFVNALLYHLGDAAADLLLQQDEQDRNQFQVIAAPSSSSSFSFSSTEEEEEDGSFVNFDLPETPEAANASPQFLRPGT